MVRDILGSENHRRKLKHRTLSIELAERRFDRKLGTFVAVVPIFFHAIRNKSCGGGCDLGSDLPVGIPVLVARNGSVVPPPNCAALRDSGQCADANAEVADYCADACGFCGHDSGETTSTVGAPSSAAGTALVVPDQLDECSELKRKRGPGSCKSRDDCKWRDGACASKRPAPQVCKEDDATWRDFDGFTCDDYVEEQWERAQSRKKRRMR